MKCSHCNIEDLQLFIYCDVVETVYGKNVLVDNLAKMICNACKEYTLTLDQIELNQLRIAAKKRLVNY